MKVQIITYGAIVQDIWAPGRNGVPADVVLGFKTLADYVQFDSPPVAPTTGVYFGETVGRYANRIANGKFTLNQPGVGPVTYTVPVNNGPNALHGGIVGFGNHVWASQPVFGFGSVGVRLTLISPNGDEGYPAGSPGCPSGCTGYPATIRVVVTYTLNNANQLAIHYTTTNLSTNLNTVLNLTNHSYFNLAGESSFPGSAYGQIITINANKYTPTNTTSIPLGYLASVFGTPMNFTTPFAMGARIQDVSANFNSPGFNQLLEAQGYDHNWVLNRPRPLRPARAQPGCHRLRPGQRPSADGLDRPARRPVLHEQLPDRDARGHQRPCLPAGCRIHVRDPALPELAQPAQLPLHRAEGGPDRQLDHHLRLLVIIHRGTNPPDPLAREINGPRPPLRGTQVADGATTARSAHRIEHVATQAPDSAAHDRLLLLDGHSLAYRAFFALPIENFSTTTGQPTNAVYGFTAMLINVLRDEKPTHVAVAFDRGEPTFRHEQWVEYKANRRETPEDFRSQLSLIFEVLDALGIRRLSAPGYEADDIIATLATQAAAEQMDVLIVTGDRDVLQLVSDRVTVLMTRRGITEMTRFTPETVQEKYGLSPAQYPDFAAVRGDPSDNLPGIPGVGEKTATKWIAEFGSLANLVDRVDEVKGKAGDALREHLASVLRNRQLTSLLTDLPAETVGAVPGDLLPIAWDREKIHQLFDTLQFRVLRDRLYQTLPHGLISTVGAPDQAALPAEPGKPALDVVADLLGPDQVAAWLASHSSAERSGLAVAGTWGRGTGQPDRRGHRGPGRSRRPHRPHDAHRRTTTGPWRPGWPTRRTRRSCTTPRAPCTPSPPAASPWRAWTATPRSPPTWRCRASAPSTWPT